MGSLAKFLQQEFHNNCPEDWECYSEKAILNVSQEALLGYSPKADVLLLRRDGSQRLWIEFEVSRADPVANHAKFATAHTFFPRTSQDIFVSMVSSHVSRGRANLAANTIWLMRQIGLQAYQTTLLPNYNPQSIFRLNHLTINTLRSENIRIKLEIERAVTVTQPMSSVEQKNLHYVANLMEVMHNIAQWNRDIQNLLVKQTWGKRRVTYFVYNPHTKEFAPSKFCAYIAIEKLTTNDKAEITGATMSIPLYIRIPWQEPIFDGHLARRHLEHNLAMELVTIKDDPGLFSAFTIWYQRYQDYFHFPNEGISILRPPPWY